MNALSEKFTSGFIYSDEFSGFEYSSTHPFKPIRAKLTLDLCRRYDLIEKPWIRLCKPEPLDFATMAEFHDESYLKVLQAVDSPELASQVWPDVILCGPGDLANIGPRLLRYGLGTEDNPIFSKVYDFSAMSAGATVLGAKMVGTDQVQVVFNPLGGFHHAGRDHAEGFCYVNDVAIAILQILKMGMRVAFIDIDAHHCNGVQDAFYEDNRVLVVSLHQSGRNLYPWSGFENEIGAGRGRGFTVNVPLPPNTDDDTYLYAFEEIVPPLLAAYAPDIVVAELGADTHIADPLTDLCLTNNGYYEVVKKIAGKAPRLLALGGGGYDLYKTARNWTLAWAAMNDLEPRDEYPGIIGGMMFGPEADAGSLFDKPYSTTGAAKEHLLQEVNRVITYLKDTVFPSHQIGKP